MGRGMAWLGYRGTPDSLHEGPPRYIRHLDATGKGFKVGLP